jgi:hypothetical protein
MFSLSLCIVLGALSPPLAASMLPSGVRLVISSSTSSVVETDADAGPAQGEPETDFRDLTYVFFGMLTAFEKHHAGAAQKILSSIVGAAAGESNELMILYRTMMGLYQAQAARTRIRRCIELEHVPDTKLLGQTLAALHDAELKERRAAIGEFYSQLSPHLARTLRDWILRNISGTRRADPDFSAALGAMSNVDREGLIAKMSLACKKET